MKTELKQYLDNPENRQALFGFYQEVYPREPWQVDAKRFEWQNICNPLLEKNSSEIWLLYDESQNIIGQNIYLPYLLRIAGKQFRGFCSTNLIVKPGIVGKGFGHKMIEKNENRDGVAFAVGITPASTRAFQKRGWILYEGARMCSRFIRPMPNLQFLGFSVWKQVVLTPLFWFINLVSTLVNLFTVPRSLPYVTYSEFDEFTPEEDQYWNSFLSDYAIFFERRWDHLNYKYKSRGDVSHTLLRFESEGKPVGYGVYRISKHPVRNIILGRIADLAYNPTFGKKLATFMIGVMARRLKQAKVDGLVGIAANKELRSAYRRNGFFLSRVQPAIIKEKGFELDGLNRKYQYTWFITLGDSDLDNYW